MTYKVTMWIHRESWAENDVRKLFLEVEADGPVDALTKLDHQWRRLVSDDISFGPVTQRPLPVWKGRNFYVNGLGDQK